MKRKLFLLTICIFMGVYASNGQIHPTGAGQFGCIPKSMIILNSNNEFEEITSNGRHYVRFLAGTLHLSDDPNDTVDVMNIHFRSDEQVIHLWNNAIRGRDLNTLKIGIESELKKPFLAKKYFESARVWIENQIVFSN